MLALIEGFRRVYKPELNAVVLVYRLRNNMHKYFRYKGGWGYRKSLTAATFACTHTTFATYVFQRVVKQMHG